MTILLLVAVAGALSACERKLSEADARALATKLANQELASRTFHCGGQAVPPQTLSGWMNVDQVDGRWVLSRTPPAGLTATVSFRLDGSDPQVAVSYPCL